MVGHFVTQFFRNIPLPRLNCLINELIHLATLYAQNMVMVAALVELKDRMPPFEMVPL
jgi:hypothetical protein